MVKAFCFNFVIKTSKFIMCVLRKLETYVDSKYIQVTYFSQILKLKKLKKTSDPLFAILRLDLLLFTLEYDIIIFFSKSHDFENTLREFNLWSCKRMPIYSSSSPQVQMNIIRLICH